MFPPKAKALHKTMSTDFSRAWLKTTSRSQAGIPFLEVQRRGELPAPNGQKGGLHPQHSGRAQAMTDGGLDGGDGDIVGPGAEDQLDGLGLDGIVDRGGRTVGANEFYIRDGNPGTADGTTHGEGGAVAFRMGGRNVVGVSGCAVAQDLSVYPGATGPGPVQGLQNQNPGPFAQGKPLAEAVEGPTGLGVHGLQGIEPGKGQLGQGFAAAGDGQIDPPFPDPVKTQADGRNRRRTGRVDGGPGPGQPIAVADLIGKAAEREGQEVGWVSFRPPLKQLLAENFGGIDAAGAGPHDYRRSLRVLETLGPAPLLNGLPGCDQPQQVGSGKAAEFPARKIIAPPQPAGLGGDLHPEPGGVEQVHRADARLPRAEGLPEFLLVSADGGRDPHSGYRHPSQRHRSTLLLSRKGKRKTPFPLGVRRGQKMERRTMMLI